MSVRLNHVFITADMELLDKHVDEFVSLYKKHHGVVLERSEAVKKGKELCRLVEMVDFESINENEYEKRQ